MPGTAKRASNPMIRPETISERTAPGMALSLANRAAARARAFAASTSRSRGGACVTSASSRRFPGGGDLVDGPQEPASFAFGGLVAPLILRVLERGGLDLLGRRSGLEVVERLMFLHMRSVARPLTPVDGIMLGGMAFRPRRRCFR